MTKAKTGGTNHKWLAEDAQGLLIELTAQHKGAIECIQRGQASNAALELAHAGCTLVAIQRLIGQMQLLIASGDATKD